MMGFLSSVRVLGAIKGTENTHNVVAQFPRLKAAHEFYHLSDYQAAIKLGRADFTAVF